MVYYKCKLSEKLNKENIMKEQRKCDDSQSQQWKYFQENNERKENKNEKKLDIIE